MFSICGVIRNKQCPAMLLRDKLWFMHYPYFCKRYMMVHIVWVGTLWMQTNRYPLTSPISVVNIDVVNIEANIYLVLWLKLLSFQEKKVYLPFCWLSEGHQNHHRMLGRKFSGIRVCLKDQLESRWVVSSLQKEVKNRVAPLGKSG